MLRIGILRDRLLSASALASILSVATVSAGASALPGGGHYVAGRGEIGKAGQSLTVTQSSTTGIIAWNSFSIGSKNTVTFDNGSGATLNRVTSGNLSRIAGSLHATGSLFLMNSSGVIVSGTGRVVTGGNFAAIGGTLSSGAFDSGERRFRPGTGAVVNHGSITAGGTATLTGATVRNFGALSARSVTLHASAGEALADGRIRAIGSAHAHILVVSASGETRIAGRLMARNADGTGGAIETSGHRVVIGGTIRTGQGGSWLIDPYNLKVGTRVATSIDDALNNATNVTLQTTASGTSGPGHQSHGPGDIDIEAALSWHTSSLLTLDAYHSVIIDAPVSVTGNGGLDITTAHDGGLSFGSGDSATFANAASALTIDGVGYTLVNSIATLAKDIKVDASGDYALANSDDASSTTGWIPIGTNGKGKILNSGLGFAGIFEGLGNTISNLTVNIGSHNYAGLFGYSTGTIRDIGLVGGSVKGRDKVGGLVGENIGTISDSYATGAVKGGDQVGGLVGYAEGAEGAITISDSYATGAVSGGGYTGGLVGDVSFSTISDSYATGAVSGGGGGYIGGLVGFAGLGTISDCYATGKVSHGEDMGGLVGYNGGGTISDSYATGAVEGHSQVGGLVGLNDHNNDHNSTIIDSYATGAVKGSSKVGGLVGWNDHSTISDSYATGAVSGSSEGGGLVGYNSNGGTVSDSYWDTQTSGQSSSAGGTGLTTAQLQTTLPNGFSSNVWAIDPDVNGGLPYLIALASSY